MSPTRYLLGDAVVITEASIRTMVNSNHSSSTPGYPSDSFIAEAKLLLGIKGEVTHVFPPGYEVTAKFGSKNCHLKDNWVERVT